MGLEADTVGQSGRMAKMPKRHPQKAFGTAAARKGALIEKFRRKVFLLLVLSILFNFMCQG